MKVRTRTIERLRDALLQSGKKQSSVVSSAYETLARSGLLSDEEKVALARVDAVTETMFLVMAADEVLTDTEVAAMRGAIRGLTGDTLSDGVIKVMLETFALRLKSEGASTRIREIARTVARDSSEAESAFALAAAVALADNDFALSEDSRLSEIADAFGFTEETVNRILDRLAEERKES